MKSQVNLTDFKAGVILFMCCLLFSFSFAQIITNTPEKESDKVKKDPIDRPLKGDPSDTEIYFGVSPMYTFRTLVTNEGLFAQDLGDRALEFGEWVSSYGFGLRSGLSEHFLLDIGIGVSRNREAFSIDRPDSLYQYSNTYRHIAIPIQIGYTYGKEISFFTSIGLMPKAFLSKRKDIHYRDYAGFEVDEKEIIRDKYQQFLVDAVGRVGFRFQANDNYGFYLMGEGFYQLSNNYVSQGPYIRRAFGVGLSLGFHVYL
jgi:hypothetical protein